MLVFINDKIIDFFKEFNNMSSLSKSGKEKIIDFFDEFSNEFCCKQNKISMCYYNIISKNFCLIFKQGDLILDEIKNKISK